MFTTIGDISEAELRKSVTCEPIPCGESVVTRWFKGEELVRQDCEIRVTQGLAISGEAGEV
jgi:hypothetical protein